MGFEAVLTPTGTWCEDAWLTTVALAQHTERLKFLVAFRPGLISPTLAAQMAATYQRVTRGRLLLNVVTGGDSAEQRRFGDRLDHDQRYARTDEFLSVVRGVWRGEPYDFHGAHYEVDGGLTSLPPDPVPELFFGGSSPAAGPVAARHADVYLTWGEPPAQVKEKIDWVRSLAEREGRTVRFGIRLHTISRDSSADAWSTAHRLLDDLDADTVAAAQAALGRSESVGQQRMLALHGGSRDRPGDLPEPLGGRRPGPGRCGHRAGRQPGRWRTDRGVPRARRRALRALRVSASGGGVLVRRGRDSRTGGPRSDRR